MEPWKFTINTFLAVTLGNFKLMDILLRDHVARLVKCLSQNPGDADFQLMHGRAASALSHWNGVYLPYRAARGVYKARTQTVYEMLESLPARLDDWDLSIQTAGGQDRPFKAGKPAYTELFPQGRTPFTSGALDQRVAAVNTLVLNMVPYAALNTVRDEVALFAAELSGARDTQQQEEGGTSTNSSGLEDSRKLAADAMFRNLGRAMDKHGASDRVGKYFDLSYIREGATLPPEGTPPAPADFTVSSVQNAADTISANWSPVPGADGYRLYRRLPGEPAWTKFGNDTTNTFASISGQPQGVLMEWAVTAFSADGEGQRSVPEEITL
jgi:hypothetical protein